MTRKDVGKRGYGERRRPTGIFPEEASTLAAALVGVRGFLLYPQAGGE